MLPTDYHQKIIQYYKDTENAYKDSWDLNNSLAIHYGYWDKAVKSFPESLTRMNEVMMIAAGIKPTDWVLDAGCGVGGSSIFLASMLGCRVTGITLSERQVKLAIENASKKESIDGLVDFKTMNYCATDFPDASFDVVWGCESICYADSKEQFIKEAFRLLKPGGRLVVADGFVSAFENNDNPIIRQWLDGWQVNYLKHHSSFNLLCSKQGFNILIIVIFPTKLHILPGDCINFISSPVYIWDGRKSTSPNLLLRCRRRISKPANFNMQG